MLKIGDKLYGYCNGYFNDDYSEKIVIAYGKDYIVVRNKEGIPILGYFPNGYTEEQIEKFKERNY